MTGNMQERASERERGSEGKRARGREREGGSERDKDFTYFKWLQVQCIGSIT